VDAKHEKSLESKGNLIDKFDNKIIEAAQLVIVDEVEDLFYIPVPDEVFKEWLVSNFLESFESFLKERFGISGVAVKVVGSDREL